VEPLAIELRRFAGLTVDAKVALSTAELEIAWSLHGEFFYLAIRRWVYDMKTPDDLGPVIRASVVSFLEGAPAALRNLKTADSIGEALPKRAPSASRGGAEQGGVDTSRPLSRESVPVRSPKMRQNTIAIRSRRSCSRTDRRWWRSRLPPALRRWSRRPWLAQACRTISNLLYSGVVSAVAGVSPVSPPTQVMHERT
jgi:hypothetical protein